MRLNAIQMKLKFILYLFVFFPLVAVAQTSGKYKSEYVRFYKAEELFQKEQYAAARIEFRNFIQEQKDERDPQVIKAFYYEGISALEMFNNDALDLLLAFNKNYPENIYKNSIYFKVGKFYYQKKEFKEAIVWLSQVNVFALDPKEKDEYFFKLGYANFQEKNNVAARAAFSEMKDGTSTYAGPGLYYFSHIAYIDKAYQTALDGFLKLQTNSSFSKVVPYYIAQIYYLQGKYAEVTKYAASTLDTISVSNEIDLDHLIGDAYFRVGKYDEALPYLEKYSKKHTTTRDDEYQLGYAYYKIGSYEKAISPFDKVAAKNDSLAQIAFYHIGECNLKLKKLVGARAAFQAASKLEFNQMIQEDALYNFAVLSYKLDLNPYDESVIALEQFIEKFPESRRISDINQYLVNVYSTTNNYAKALASLDKLPKKDAKLKAVYQLVAFNQGVAFFQKDEFEKAIQSFELVEKHPIEPSYTARARFWSADAYFRLNKIDKAIATYKDFLAMPATLAAELKPDAYYNLGYAYLRSKDILQSIESFRLYCQSSTKNKTKLADAYSRIGDGYYMTKQNENAIKNYLEVIKLKVASEDQALFYLAKSYGFANQEDKKISYLLDIINNYKNSKYILQAVFEVANSYKAKSEFDKATRYFTQVMEDYPTSNLVLPSRIEIADIHYKKWEYAKAEKEYLALLNSNGEDQQVCATVVRGLVDVYTATKQPEKANQMAIDYSCANISPEEQENMFYAPAIEAFRDSSFALAASNFEKYLVKFPTGRFKNDATFFMANAYFSAGDKEKAIAAYQKILEVANNSYTETAAARVAQHFYNSGKYDEAIVAYSRIDKLSSKPALIFNTKLGLMRCNFLLQNWENTVLNAKAVLESSQLNNTIRIEAEYAKGLAEFSIENYAEAKSNLEYVIKNATTVLAAEARYTLAELYAKQEDYKKADAEVNGLIKMKPSYNFWVAKGLLLQAKLLIVQKDYFQAEQRLRSVIDHYPVKDDEILTNANALLDELMQLKNQIKPVEKQEETIIDVKEEN